MPVPLPVPPPPGINLPVPSQDPHADVVAAKSFQAVGQPFQFHSYIKLNQSTSQQLHAPTADDAARADVYKTSVVTHTAQGELQIPFSHIMLTFKA
jgi:hypothetical protein